MTYKTTKRHFEIFKKEFLKWRDFWGLFQYRVYFYHGDIDACYGRCDADLGAMHATITLSDEWPKPINDYSIKQTAFHECCELLLARFNVNAYYRHATKNDIEESNHEIIRTLENKIFERSIKK